MRKSHQHYFEDVKKGDLVCLVGDYLSTTDSDLLGERKGHKIYIGRFVEYDHESYESIVLNVHPITVKIETKKFPTPNTKIGRYGSRQFKFRKQENQPEPGSELNITRPNDPTEIAFDDPQFLNLTQVIKGKAEIIDYLHTEFPSHRGSLDNLADAIEKVER